MPYTFILITIGVICFVISIYSIVSIIRVLDHKSKNRFYWQIAIAFICLFTLGYIGSLILLYLHLFESLSSLIGLIFFGGAFFVTLVTRIGKNTLVDMEMEVQDRTQKLNIAKEEAIQSNQAKSNFISTMNHEIRTPLTAITSVTDILKELEFNEDIKHYIEILERASNNLLYQINSILDFSKIEANYIELEEIPFCLNESLENVYKIMQGRCLGKEVQIQKNINLPPQVSVYADPTRLEQILINLLGNALKFTLQGSVSLNVALISENDLSYEILFEVTDTGIGIPENKIDNIFESFTQADTSITRRFGGTGLGLTITKKFIEMMGGKIQCKSTLGVGSIFYFTLHIKKDINKKINTNKGIKKIDTNHSSLKNIKILLVEDNQDNRFLFSIFLKEANLTLDCAENGAIAVKKICEEGLKYDLIFMDIQMPVMDGFTAMKHIRSWEKENKQDKAPVNIIALTASSTKEDVMKSYECGCTEYLSKPIRKEILLDAVKRYSELSLC